MSEPQEILPIGKNDLMGIVAQLFAEGYRLVQIGCSTLPSSYELNYSFDKDYRFKNLRFTVGPNEEVPSITAVYHNAFLYENEIHDLFGLNVKNIAVDYHGTLFHTAIKTPFSIENVKLPQPPAPVASSPDTGAPQPKAEAPKQDTQASPQDAEPLKQQTDSPEPQGA